MQITQAKSPDLLAQVLNGDEEGYFSRDCVRRSSERAIVPPEQIDRHYQNDVTQMLWSAATAAFVRSVSNFWSVTSFPSTSETTDEIFGAGDRDGRVMMIPWPRRC
jgi:hypothetical protein